MEYRSRYVFRHRGSTIDVIEDDGGWWVGVQGDESLHGPFERCGLAIEHGITAAEAKRTRKRKRRRKDTDHV